MNTVGTFRTRASPGRHLFGTPVAPFLEYSKGKTISGGVGSANRLLTNRELPEFQGSEILADAPAFRQSASSSRSNFSYAAVASMKRSTAPSFSSSDRDGIFPIDCEFHGELQKARSLIGGAQRRVTLSPPADVDRLSRQHSRDVLGDPGARHRAIRG